MSANIAITYLGRNPCALTSISMQPVHLASSRAFSTGLRRSKLPPSTRDVRVHQHARVIRGHKSEHACKCICIYIYTHYNVHLTHIYIGIERGIYVYLSIYIYIHVCTFNAIIDSMLRYVMLCYVMLCYVISLPSWPSVVPDAVEHNKLIKGEEQWTNQNTV